MWKGKILIKILQFHFHIQRNSDLSFLNRNLDSLFATKYVLY
jgi:hypothetical protein